MRRREFITFKATVIGWRTAPRSWRWLPSSNRVAWLRAFLFLTADAAVEIRMLARPRLTKPPDETAAEKPKDQTRPKEERFLLRVDGQTKRSFSSKDPRWRPALR